MDTHTQRTDICHNPIFLIKQGKHIKKSKKPTTMKEYGG